MHTTRRALLAGTGATLVATAGCLGSVTGSGGGDSNCDLSARSPVESLPAPSLGPDDAGVTVMSFEDFSCPHCQTYHLEEFPSIESELVGGDVRYEHHDLPIPVSQQWSWAAASAARAVQDSTDDETFFAYAKSLFENQGSYSMSLVESLANDVGADGCDVRAAAENGRYRPVLEADRQRGLDMGVQGTPTVFVNGQEVTATFDAVRAAVERAQS
ncbi:protein-disulfide isomerase [Salinigranum rubrum]|uniref:Protein-disulfide isomerase n=1 Tax=Salinigranum rubrum TaxID=755307 RepID=A0A2I8VI63_9EURY|nr:thioredoxin domain-containing protein [Salinigranum rubrum]AUV81574.1 protein-disulfide isomerase [Salinigranum rubrum]